MSLWVGMHIAWRVSHHDVETLCTWLCMARDSVSAMPSCCGGGMEASFFMVLPGVGDRGRCSMGSNMILLNIRGEGLGGIGSLESDEADLRTFSKSTGC